MTSWRPSEGYFRDFVRFSFFNERVQTNWSVAACPPGVLQRLFRRRLWRLTSDLWPPPTEEQKSGRTSRRCFSVFFLCVSGSLTVRQSVVSRDSQNPPGPKRNQQRPPLTESSSTWCPWATWTPHRGTETRLHLQICHHILSRETCLQLNRTGPVQGTSGRPGSTVGTRPGTTWTLCVLVGAQGPAPPLTPETRQPSKTGWLLWTPASPVCSEPSSWIWTTEWITLPFKKLYLFF